MDIKGLIKGIKDKEKSRELIYLLAALIVLIGYLSFLLPKLTSLTRLFSETRRLKLELKSAKAEIGRMDEYRQKAGLLSSRMAEYERKLPREEEIDALLESLSRMAISADVRILGIVPVRSRETEKEEEEKGISRELPIKITAKSGYFELLDFIKRLEEGMRFVKIADIKIEGDEREPRRHDIELLIKTFVMAGEK